MTSWIPAPTNRRPAPSGAAFPNGGLYVEFAQGEVPPESLLVVDRAVQDGGFGLSVRLIRKGLCVKFSVSARKLTERRLCWTPSPPPAP